YAPNGDLLWARTAGGPTNDAAFGVDTDKDGNVYVTGAYSGLAVFGDTLVSNVDPDGAGLPFTFVARYSPAGDLVWVRTMDVGFLTGIYPYAIGYAIKVDRLGDLVIVGAYNNTLASTSDPAISTMSFDGQGFRTSGLNGYDYTYVHRMDTLGNTEWVHTVGGLNGLGTLLSIAFDGQNNIWAGGNVYSNPFTPYIDGPVNLGISASTTLTGAALEYDATGQPLNGFLLNCNEQSNVEDLIVAGNGDVYLSGWHRGSFFGSPAASGIDGFLMRATAGGTPVWTHRLVGVSDDFFSGIATTTQANELVGGAYYFFQADFAGTTLAQSVGTISALVRVDTMGTLLEAVQPGVLAGYSLIADVQSDLFGNFYLCGDVGGQVRFGPDTLQCLSQDMYVSKLGPAVPQSVAERPSTAGSWTLYPNPAQDMFTIADAERDIAFTVHAADGTLVRSVPPATGPRTVDLGGLANGLYLVRDDRGRAQRLVVAR
ncbi:MAG: T9SS type A sorting domain-containing protein, partial [Flavobacteriales bacterium]|nr:T9SS type A sorting domain-containing protein [Flavobacteriales bacterium]